MPRVQLPQVTSDCMRDSAAGIDGIAVHVIRCRSDSVELGTSHEVTKTTFTGMRKECVSMELRPMFGNQASADQLVLVLPVSA
jgi:hypothetical protein